ncbi:MAG: hypothetical protein KAR06_08110 [Deltaproteobacteria bacterium]|nr:hypothetical protein [Deltaproteobacteria bacterium]
MIKRTYKAENWVDDKVECTINDNGTFEVSGEKFRIVADNSNSDINEVMAELNIYLLKLQHLDGENWRMIGRGEFEAINAGASEVQKRCANPGYTFGDGTISRHSISDKYEAATKFIANIM